MTVKTAGGSPVAKSGLDKTAYTPDDPQFTINVAYYSEDPMVGAPGRLVKRRLFRAGQVVRQSAIDAAFPDATLTGISPATGSHLGGTTVTITGTHLRGVTGVTFGGTAGTGLANVTENSLTIVTPAKAAGAYDVIVTDDSGADTLTAGYTFT